MHPALIFYYYYTALLLLHSGKRLHVLAVESSVVIAAVDTESSQSKARIQLYGENRRIYRLTVMCELPGLMRYYAWTERLVYCF